LGFLTYLINFERFLVEQEQFLISLLMFFSRRLTANFPILFWVFVIPWQSFEVSALFCHFFHWFLFWSFSITAVAWNQIVLGSFVRPWALTALNHIRSRRDRYLECYIGAALKLIHCLTSSSFCNLTRLFFRHTVALFADIWPVGLFEASWMLHFHNRHVDILAGSWQNRCGFHIFLFFCIFPADSRDLPLFSRQIGQKSPVIKLVNKFCYWIF